MKTFNKSLLIKILVAVLIVGGAIALSLIPLLDRQKPQEKEPIERHLRVRYSVDEEYCRLVGKGYQLVKKGEDATPVTIYPKLGYVFVGWVTAENQDELFDTDVFTRHDTNIQEDLWLIAKFAGPVNSRVRFEAGKGGSIEGKLEQEVIYGGDGERVTAVPAEGFRFIGWSDGETEATRENRALRYLGSLPYEIYAQFERYSRKFEYVFNQGVSSSKETEVEINLDNIDTLSLPVPTRENCRFEGWYSDWHYEVQVADENGNILVGVDWLDNDWLYLGANPEGFLYAKWTTEKVLPTYKILMAYITEVHGNFLYLYKDKEVVELRIDYVMTEKHRKICNLITEYMRKYLNAIFNETVRFEVDEYFTQEPVSEEQFTRTLKCKYTPCIDATNGIREIREKLNDYDSVITSYSLRGYESNNALTAGSGSTKAGRHDATVVLDYALSYLIDTDIEDLSDFSDEYCFRKWEWILTTYIHELIHTIENKTHIMDNVGLHASIGYYNENNNPERRHHLLFGVYIPFLLHTFEVGDGEYWGIPPEFWLNYYR